MLVVRTVRPGLARPRTSAPPPLPPYADSLARDVRRAVSGEVRFSPGARALYAYDASIFRRTAFSWDGPVIIECLVDQHEPPMPAKVKKKQVTAMVEALREGTPNRNRIALQMVKDLLDESTFDASPGHVIPGKVG